MGEVSRLQNTEKGLNAINSILIWGTGSAYNALVVFYEQLAEHWRNMGIHVEIYELICDEVLDKIDSKYYDVILSMNGTLCDVKSKAGENLVDNLPIPCYSFYVDHPLYHHERIMSASKQHCVFTDSTFYNYVQRYYDLCNPFHVVMQGGIEGNNSSRSYEERKYQVVFCGSYRELSQDEIEEYPERFQKIMQTMIEEGIHNPIYTIEQLLGCILKRLGMTIDDKNYTNFMCISRPVESNLRGYYRQEIVRRLVDSGIRVDVFGAGWERLSCKRKDLLVCHEPIDYTEMPNLFEDSKIVLNVMPWAKGSFHDRVACGMLNGALVVSDETIYLNQCNCEEEKCVVYSLNDLEDMVGKIKYYLEHEEEAKIIANHGYKWAKENHTWKQRAEQMIEIMEQDLYAKGVNAKSVEENPQEGGRSVESDLDIKEELNNVLELWNQIEYALIKCKNVSEQLTDYQVLDKLTGDIFEMTQCSVDIKTELCGGGGLFWNEKQIIEITKLLSKGIKEQNVKVIWDSVDSLLMSIRKLMLELDERLSKGVYNVNMGKVQYKDGVDVANIPNLETAIRSMDECTMNPLEHFFYKEKHNYMTKWSHYFEIYHQYFDKFRNKPVKVLEIGVFGGGSLQMWKKYFGVECQIVGVDIMPECKDYEEEQIKIYIGSQGDRNFLQEIIKEEGMFDIIIDDGSYRMEHQIVSFEELYPCLADNGVYICEDTHTSYWNDFGGGYKSETSYIEYTKQFVDCLCGRYSTCQELSLDEFTKTLKGIHYYDSMVVFEKKSMKPSIPFWLEGYES